MAAQDGPGTVISSNLPPPVMLRCLRESTRTDRYSAGDPMTKRRRSRCPLSHQLGQVSVALSQAQGLSGWLLDPSVLASEAYDQRARTTHHSEVGACNAPVVLADPTRVQHVCQAVQIRNVYRERAFDIVPALDGEHTCGGSGRADRRRPRVSRHLGTASAPCQQPWEDENSDRG
jgi:hypothetical protein